MEFKCFAAHAHGRTDQEVAAAPQRSRHLDRSSSHSFLTEYRCSPALLPPPAAALGELHAPKVIFQEACFLLPGWPKLSLHFTGTC